MTFRYTCQIDPGPHTWAPLQVWNSASSSFLSSSYSTAHPTSIYYQVTWHNLVLLAYCMLWTDCLSHQLLLQVYGPDDCIVSYGENEEEEEAQLSITHLPHSSVIENRLPPIRESIHQDVIIPAEKQILRPGLGTMWSGSELWLAEVHCRFLWEETLRISTYLCRFSSSLRTS